MLTVDRCLEAFTGFDCAGATATGIVIRMKFDSSLPFPELLA